MANHQDSWFERWQSPERWSKYLLLAGNSDQRAIELYELNSALASALMHDIAHLEVALRNRYDAVINQNFDGATHWLFDPHSPVNQPLFRMRNGKQVDLNSRNRTAIAEAVRRTRQVNPSPGKVIPELSFGFWRHLTDAAHERTLWMPCLMWAFPPGTWRKAVGKQLAVINHVRNRVSHHEILLGARNLEQVIAAQAGVQELAGMLIPELAEHLAKTSTVDSVLEEIRRQLQ